MQSQSRLLEDLARVASSAMGVAAGMREEVEARLRDQFERILDRMELVTREEFDVVRAMAEKARAEQLDLADRVAALETQLAASNAKPARRKAKSTRAAKPKS